MASHRICPTCASVLPDKQELRYMASTTAYAPEADDVDDWYEQVEKFTLWIGALAIAGPLAVAYAEPDDGAGWVENLRWLAEQLNDELELRMDRLWEAIHLQRQQAQKAIH